MDNEDLPAIKRPRTSEDFYLFCTYILEYENYERQIQEELRNKSASPMDSAGLVSDSNLSSGQEDNSKPTDDDSSGQYNNYVDSDSYDLVTCYCNKPFAGRPMIECTNCLTWIHLSCAKIRKKHIPEVFYCAMCKSAATNSKDISGNTSPSSGNTSSGIVTNMSSSAADSTKTQQSAIVSPSSPTRTRHFKNIIPVQSPTAQSVPSAINRTYAAQQPPTSDFARNSSPLPSYIDTAATFATNAKFTTTTVTHGGDKSHKNLSRVNNVLHKSTNSTLKRQRNDELFSN